MTSRITNADGLASRTTIAEYEGSDAKILVLGDSFTCWNQQGTSWPDLCEAELDRRQEKSVGLLNYAHGGYGVIQMLELAADMVRLHQPDLIIFAIIGPDFARDRWWDKVTTGDGLTRWLKSSRKDVFDDYRYAVDVMLVDERANRAWCERMRAGVDATREDRELLTELTNRFVRLRAEVYAVRRRSSWFAINRSFLASRITRGYPYKYRPRSIPALPIDDFAESAQAVRAVRALQREGVPMLLFYLPNGRETAAGRPLVNHQTKQLMSSLERLTGQTMINLASQHRTRPPEKIDLLPIDSHPNHDGLVWYAKEIADVVEEHSLSGRRAKE